MLGHTSICFDMLRSAYICSDMIRSLCQYPHLDLYQYINTSNMLSISISTSASSSISICSDIVPYASIFFDILVYRHTAYSTFHFTHSTLHFIPNQKGASPELSRSLTRAFQELLRSLYGRVACADLSCFGDLSCLGCRDSNRRI